VARCALSRGSGRGTGVEAFVDLRSYGQMCELSSESVFRSFSLPSFFFFQPLQHEDAESNHYKVTASSHFSYSCKRDPKAAEDQAEAAMCALRSVHGTLFSVGGLLPLSFPHLLFPFDYHLVPILLAISLSLPGFVLI
jgi:hypothetical protein